MFKMNFLKIVCLSLLLLNGQRLYPQKEGKLRMDISVDVGRGLLFKQLDLGIGASINPSYLISENQKLGINVSVFAILKNLENKEFTERQAISSLLGTYDLYFGQQSNFAFSIGGGLGIYQIDHDISQLLLYSSGNIVNQKNTLFSGYKPGLMIRPGLEFGKFRLGLECNFLPSYSYESTITNQSVSNDNLFFKWNLGIFLGGGRHKARFNW
jgi:hypothetical protein